LWSVVGKNASFFEATQVAGVSWEEEEEKVPESKE
jgi:hypothetical protein